MLQRRRDLLKAAAGGAASLAFPFAGRATSLPTDLTVTRLSDELIAITGAEGNVVAARGSDGVLMVDGGPAHQSKSILSAVFDTFSVERVGVLYNTHWHPEQTGSNEALGGAGTQIIAHENTRQWLTAEVTWPWNQRTHAPLPDAALPDETFYTSGRTSFGDLVLEYGYMLQAHTDGDIYVYFPGANVLVTGGVVSNDGWPLIDWWTGGWIGGLLDGFDLLMQVGDADTRIVPGSGPLMTRGDLEAQRAMYLTIFDRLHEMLIKSFGLDEVLAAAPTREFDQRWGDSELFVTLAFRSFWGHLRGSKRVRGMP
jgi:glyoxylase-like metal-dependent hydrolase (beta-lactamase superfamily II)